MDYEKRKAAARRDFMKSVRKEVAPSPAKPKRGADVSVESCPACKKPLTQCACADNILQK